MCAALCGSQVLGLGAGDGSSIHGCAWHHVRPRSACTPPKSGSPPLSMPFVLLSLRRGPPLRSPTPDVPPPPSPSLILSPTLSLRLSPSLFLPQSLSPPLPEPSPTSSDLPHIPHVSTLAVPHPPPPHPPSSASASASVSASTAHSGVINTVSVTGGI